MTMTPSRAYLLRALNEWILDNNCTPYIVVDATADGVCVPVQHIKNGQIVLNINPIAVRALDISNEAVCFEARFGGEAESIYAPIESIMAVYAKENGQGMVFGWENEPHGPSPSDSKSNAPDSLRNSGHAPKSKKSSKPSLKVVK